MAAITGRFIADLNPNGTVRAVLLASQGGGNESPVVFETLDAAMEFLKSFMPLEKAVTFLQQLDRDKRADAVVGMDEKLAATFRNQPLRID
jgi:ABC-type thiamine transport system substrate-binding protein